MLQLGKLTDLQMELHKTMSDIHVIVIGLMATSQNGDIPWCLKDSF